MDVICYRGGGGEMPENTLMSIAHCMEVNADWRIEIDLRITADNRVVLVHDERLSRLAGVEVEVDQMSYEELKNYNVAYHFNEVFNTQLHCQIPLLEDVIEKFPNTKFVLDIHDIRAVKGVLKLINDYDLSSQVVVVSEDDRVIRSIKKSNPNIQCGAATQEAKRLWLSSMLRLDGLFPLRSDILTIPAQYKRRTVLSTRICKHVSRRNKKIWIYTDDAEEVVAKRRSSQPLDCLINDAAKYRLYENRRVDAVFTDYPKALQKSLMQ